MARSSKGEKGTAVPTVFVVDDDLHLRKALSLLLDSVDINVETFESAQAFLKAFDPDRVGCLVLDIRMPGMSGLELQEILVSRGIQIPTLVLTAHAEIPMAVEAVRAGAMEFIEKPYSPQILLDCINRALEQATHDRQESAKMRVLRGLFQSLTPREQAVLQRFADGMNSKQIGVDLNISATTVDFHRRNLMEKLKAENAIELGRLYEAHQREDMS